MPASDPLTTPTAAASEASTDRYLLFRSVRALLTPPPGGAALVLDDLHWADPASVQLTEYLLRRPPEGPLLIAVAHRTSHPPTGLADALARWGKAVVRVAVDPLGPHEIAALSPAARAHARPPAPGDSR
jgi:hypothetical protein